MRVAVLEDDISQLELLSHWLELTSYSVQGFQQGLLLLKALGAKGLMLCCLTGMSPIKYAACSVFGKGANRS